MYNALDIARYIIKHENSADRSVSNLRLQKLLYFVQAQFLVSKHEPCFNGRMEAWNFGPVVPEVYHEYKMFGSTNIPDSLSDSNINLSDQDRTLIDKILDHCAQLSSTTLVSITHNQKPWKEAYVKPYDNEITNKSILSYFEVKNG